jgi:hypothetical protein
VLKGKREREEENEIGVVEEVRKEQLVRLNVPLSTQTKEKEREGEEGEKEDVERERDVPEEKRRV